MAYVIMLVTLGQDNSINYKMRHEKSGREQHDRTPSNEWDK